MIARGRAAAVHAHALAREAQLEGELAGMGRVVADLVAGNATGHDLSRFRYARFTDGSKIAPGPTL